MSIFSIPILRLVRSKILDTRSINILSIKPKQIFQIYYFLKLLIVFPSKIIAGLNKATNEHKFEKRKKGDILVNDKRIVK
jgi:hypothetical protein